MKATKVLMPRARQDDLFVEELQDETLVYDLKRHKARCLNGTAALVWRCCDGRKTVAEVVTLLEEQTSTPTDESVVWMALDRLSRAQLLSEPVTLPADRTQYSRREMLRKLRRVAGISLLLPVIESITAPLAGAQASCQTSCAGRPNCSACGNTCNRVCCNGTCVNTRQAAQTCGC